MSPSVRAENDPKAIASITVDGGPQTVRLQGRALGLSAGHVDARMTIRKSGPSGQMSTTQGGTVDLSEGQDVAVATVSLAIAAGDRLDVDLVLTSDQREVARGSLVVGP